VFSRPRNQNETKPNQNENETKVWSFSCGLPCLPGRENLKVSLLLPLYLFACLQAKIHHCVALITVTISPIFPFSATPLFLFSGLVSALLLHRLLLEVFVCCIQGRVKFLFLFFPLPAKELGNWVSVFHVYRVCYVYVLCKVGLAGGLPHVLRQVYLRL
jgi:hypothetical protein